MDLKKIKVAIVHDWLVGGGAERVVYQLHMMFPDAPIYTSYCTDEWRKKLDNKVVTGFLQAPLFARLRKYVGLLRMWYFSRLDFSSYDLVISSTGNGEAKGIKVPSGTTHICYCHSPTHYYWRHFNQYVKQPGFGIFDPLARLGLRILVEPLRAWDHRAAQRPDYLIANSSHIQHDIKKFYGRTSTVIFPPIDTNRFTIDQTKKRSGFVTLGRLVPAKRTDIIIEACNQLNLPLTIIGDGPDYPRLRALAGPTVTFLNKATGTRVSDEAMPGYLSSAEAFIFASFDDFGIAPIEAMAAGTPVIAYRAGGALDYVKEGKTGLFFERQTADALKETLTLFKKPQHFDHAYIQNYASQFNPEVFTQKMDNFIRQSMASKE